MGAPDCPIERSVTVLDGKWTLLILRELFLSANGARPGLSARSRLAEPGRVLAPSAINQSDYELT
jgi:hypothetical protein